MCSFWIRSKLHRFRSFDVFAQSAFVFSVVLVALAAVFVVVVWFCFILLLLFFLVVVAAAPAPAAFIVIVFGCLFPFLFRLWCSPCCSCRKFSLKPSAKPHLTSLVAFSSPSLFCLHATNHNSGFMMLIQNLIGGTL